MESLSSSVAALLEQSVYSCDGIVESPTKGQWDFGGILNTLKVQGSPSSATGSFQAMTEGCVN